MKKVFIFATMAIFAILTACGDDSSSGPEMESSSSVEAEEGSSSSEETSSSLIVANTSSSLRDAASSSSAVIASSSSANGSSSSIADEVCYGEYGAEYTCVTTKYLNQDMLDTNGYGEFVDTRDKKVYKTVIIGEGTKAQTWMAQNLNYDYNDGTAESHCYSDDDANCDKYGRLYTWSAAMDSAGVFSNDCKGCGYGTVYSAGGTIQGVCPEGWHLPNKAEWDTLFTNVGEEDVAGRMLKSEEGWNDYSESTEGIDSYGFSALPAGYRDYYGDFYKAGLYANFWSSSEYDSNYAYSMYLGYDGEDANLDNSIKYFAFSVRCVQD